MGRRFFKVLRYVLLFLIAGALAVLVLWVIKNKKPEEYTSPTPAVRTAVPTKGTISQSLRFNAYVEAADVIPVVPFVNGTVLEFYPKQGDQVEKDDVLVEIDPQPYELQRQQAEAAYNAAAASYERVEKLAKINAATDQQLDEVRAQRDAFKAQMELAGVQKDYATVRAPVSGTILTVNSAKGSIAGQGNLLCAIANLDNMVVNVAIPEKYYTKIKDNLDGLTASVLHGDDRAEAVYENLSPFINPQSKTFILKLRLKGTPEELAAFRPGMFVTAVINYLTLQDVPVMPLTAVNTDGTMYIVDAETRKARMLDFKPAARDNENFLVPDEYASASFIVDGQGTVFDGQPVRVVE